MERKRMLVTMVLLLGAALLAQGNEPSKKTADKKGITLNNETLGTMLEGLGLSPKEGKYKSGATYFDVVMVQDGWDHPTRVALSPDSRVVWLHLTVADLPPLNMIPIEKLLNLLRKTASTTGKAMFCVRGEHLMLLQPIDNHEVTPARMLEELRNLCGAARLYAKDVDVAQWTAAVSVAPKTEQAKEFNALRGAWKVVSAIKDGKTVENIGAAELVLEFKDGKLIALKKGQPAAQPADLRFTSGTSPKYLDVLGGGGSFEPAIFKIEGETLTLCLAAPGASRPREFISKPGTNHTLFVLKRADQS